MDVQNMTVDGLADTELCWKVQRVVQPTGGPVGWSSTSLLPGPAVQILEDLPGGRGEGVHAVLHKYIGPTQAVHRKSPLSFKGMECRPLQL